MKIKNAYFPKAFPASILLITTDGKHYLARRCPFHHIQDSELHHLPVYDSLKPERFWDSWDEIPEYALRFYGLEKET